MDPLLLLLPQDLHLLLLKKLLTDLFVGGLLRGIRFLLLIYHFFIGLARYFRFCGSSRLLDGHKYTMIGTWPHYWRRKLLLQFLGGLLVGRHGNWSYWDKCSAVFIIVQNLIFRVLWIHYHYRTGDVGLSEFILRLHLVLEHLLGLLRQVRRLLSVDSHATKRYLLRLS